MFTLKTMTRIALAALGAMVNPMFDAAAIGDREVAQFIDRWNGAYRALNAAALASLESEDFRLVDRFGQVHSPSGRTARSEVWAAGFEAIDRAGFVPELKLRRIEMTSHDAAEVEVCARYAGGIALVDGGHIPPLWETESFVILKTRGRWLVQRLNVRDEAAEESCGAAR